MSTTRILIRVALVLILVLVCFVGYYVWRMNTPDYFWAQAQAAIEREDYRSAQRHLENLLKKTPDHAAGNAAMVAVLRELVDASPADSGDEEAARRAGLLRARNAHVLKAAELMADDLDLQKQALLLLANAGNIRGAAPFAERVHEKETENPTALYVLAADAFNDDEYQEALDLVEQGLKQDSRFPFRMLQIKVGACEKLDQKDGVKEAVDFALALGTRITDDSLAGLSVREKQVIPAMMAQSVAMSASPQEAIEHAEKAVSILKTLLEVNSKRPTDPRIPSLFAAIAMNALRNQTIRTDLTDDEKARIAALEKQLGELLDLGLAQERDIPEERREDIIAFYEVAAAHHTRNGRLDEAEAAANMLLKDERAAGVGELRLGHIAAERGQYKVALRHFLKARDQLGDVLDLRMLLVETYGRLGMWEEALPLLATLHVPTDSLTENQLHMYRKLVGSEDRLHLRELNANLQLKRWDEARKHFNAIKGTPSESTGTALMAAYMWSNGNKDEAESTLREAREKFPDSLALTNVDARFRTEKGSPDALAPVEEFVSRNPKNLLARLQLAQQYAVAKNYDKAIEVLGQVEKDFADSEGVPNAARVFRAKVLLAQGRKEEAVELVEPLLNDPRVGSEAGKIKIAASADDTEAMARLLEDVAELRPNDPLIALQQGVLASQKGDLDAALSLFSESLDVTSLSAKSEAAVVGTLLRIERERGPEAALTETNRLLEKSPDHGRLLVMKAVFLSHMNRSADALAVLDGLQTAQPKYVLAYLAKGDILGGLNLPAQALEQYEKAIELGEKRLSLLSMAARLAASLDRVDRALELTDMAIEADPGNMGPSLTKAAILRQNERYDEAAAIIEGLLAKQPDSPDLHLQLYMTYDAAGQPAKALDALRAGRKAAPDNKVLAVYEIRHLAKNDQADEAMKLADELVGDGKDASVLVAIGQAMTDIKRRDDAIRFFEQALEAVDPQNVAGEIQVRLMLGDLFMSKNAETPKAEWLAAAQKHYEAILAKNPRNGVAANNLAWILAVDLGRTDEAVAVVDKAFEGVNPGILPGNVVHTIAVVRRQAGQLDAANAAVSAVLEREPDNPQLLLEMGQISLDREDFDRGLAALEHALQLDLSDADKASAERLIERIKTAQTSNAGSN